MSKIARYYNAEKNPDKRTFPGVPLADITEEQWEEYPAWLRKSIDDDESGMYRKTPVPDSKPEKRETKKAQDDQGKE